jgi:peptidyl-prolyl cis-trans isomerase D
VFDQNQPLKQVAETLKLNLQTAANVNRTAGKGAKGALGNQKFLSAIFSTDSLEKKGNTEAVEIGSSQFASGRVIQYVPAKVAALAEVKDRARALLVQNRGEELAKKEGAQKLAEFKAATDASKLPAPLLISRMKPEGQTGKVLDAALSVDPTTLPAVVGVDLGAQGYAVVRVNKVIQDAPVDPAQQKQFASQISQSLSNAEVMAYFEVLKARYKVEIKPAALVTPDADKK